MFNDDGLGQAMAVAHLQDQINALQERIKALNAGRDTFKEFFEMSQGCPWEPEPGTRIDLHMRKIAEATAAWNDAMRAGQQEAIARLERAVFPLGA